MIEVSELYLFKSMSLFASLKGVVLVDSLWTPYGHLEKVGTRRLVDKFDSLTQKRSEVW